MLWGMPELFPATLPAKVPVVGEVDPGTDSLGLSSFEPAVGGLATASGAAGGAGLDERHPISAKQPGPAQAAGAVR
jgi:hypothetical protein